MFYSDTCDTIDNFTCIVLTIIAPVFDLGMSFGKVKSEKSPEKSGNCLEICIQSCVGTLYSICAHCEKCVMKLDFNRFFRYYKGLSPLTCILLIHPVVQNTFPMITEIFWI